MPQAMVLGQVGQQLWTQIERHWFGQTETLHERRQSRVRYELFLNDVRAGRDEGRQLAVQHLLLFGSFCQNKTILI